MGREREAAREREREREREGEREREPGYHSYATPFKKLSLPSSPLCWNEQERKCWNVTKSQRERSGPRQGWMKRWKERKAQWKYLMYLSAALFIHTFILFWGAFSQYEVSLKLLLRSQTAETSNACVLKYNLPAPIWSKKKPENWPFCCRGQLNNDSHWRSGDDGRPRTIHRKGSEISWGFVYRFGSHKH